MDSTYAGAYGHVKALYLNLLRKDEIDRIKETKKEEFMNVLSSTSYKNEIDQFYNRFKEPDIIDIVVNTHFLNQLSLISSLSISALIMNERVEATERELALNIGRYLSCTILFSSTSKFAISPSCL